MQLLNEKSRSKRFVAMCLIVALLLGCLPANVFEVSATSGQTDGFVTPISAMTARSGGRVNLR